MPGQEFLWLPLREGWRARSKGACLCCTVWRCSGWPGMAGRGSGGSCQARLWGQHAWMGVGRENPRLRSPARSAEKQDPVPIQLSLAVVARPALTVNCHQLAGQVGGAPPRDASLRNGSLVRGVTPGNWQESAGYQGLRQQPAVRREGLYVIRKILSFGTRKADVRG